MDDTPDQSAADASAAAAAGAAAAEGPAEPSSAAASASSQEAGPSSASAPAGSVAGVSSVRKTWGNPENPPLLYSVPLQEPSLATLGNITADRAAQKAAKEARQLVSFTGVTL